MATSTSSTASSTSSAASASSSTSNPNNTDNSSGSKPLLFFVALGFGVVFTNLWIIVGVKYCFRYNRRNRRRIDAETGEPMDLANMPRPRRRREKKLMSMDEVNERFPLTKYKTWRATREQQGLPAEGGVVAPPSRPASVKEIDNLLERTSTEVDEPSFAGEPSFPTSGSNAEPISDKKNVTTVTTERPASAEITTVSAPTHDPSPPPRTLLDETKKTALVTETETDASAATPMSPADEEDPIQIAALPNNAELLQNPGDACAICIDNLDDDDDVRGLSCGHAFHAGCLDPWLTNRRACCPLCKADYYVPKTRADGQADADAATRAAGANAVQPPASAWTAMGDGRGPLARGHRVVFGGSRYHVDTHERFGFPVLVRDPVMPYHNGAERRAQTGRTHSAATGGAQEAFDRDGPGSSIGGRMLRRMVARMRPEHNERNSSAALAHPVTRPTQAADQHAVGPELEAGRPVIS